MNRDPRGVFTEVFCDHWDLAITPSQWSVVNSMARVLRGMHLHVRHDEYIAVLSGRGCVGLHDLRPDSPTFRRHALIELSGEHQSCLVFPRGIVHGWYFFEPTIHLQGVSESYVSYQSDDNLTCLWSDPELGIAWPDPDPILSERARRAGSLAEFMSKVASLEEAPAAK